MAFIKFVEQSLNEKQHLASDLRNTLNSSSNGIVVDIKKEDENTQDAGTILSLVLGSSLLTSIAKGLFNWLQRNKGIEMELTSGNEKLKIKCSSKNDLEEIEKILQKVLNN